MYVLSLPISYYYSSLDSLISLRICELIKADVEISWLSRNKIDVCVNLQCIHVCVFECVCVSV